MNRLGVVRSFDGVANRPSSQVSLFIFLNLNLNVPNLCFLHFQLPLFIFFSVLAHCTRSAARTVLSSLFSTSLNEFPQSLAD